jgi:hypothetical protein
MGGGKKKGLVGPMILIGRWEDSGMNYRSAYRLTGTVSPTDVNDLVVHASVGAMILIGR